MDKIKQAVLVSSQKSTVQDRCTIHIMYLPLIDINVKKTAVYTQVNGE